MDLREKIVDIIMYGDKNRVGDTAFTKADQILALLEGWKSPEEVIELLAKKNEKLVEWVDK